jgi:hypothetical protein
MGWVVIILAVVGIVVLLNRSIKKDKEKILSKYNFSPEEKQMFESRKLWIGMPVDALYVVLGYGEQNKTTTAGGEHIQHVYKDSDEYHYVYTENGIVSSWQGK